MASRITISPSEVLSIANTIASLNDRLKETLEATNKKVQDIDGQGQGINATKDNFNQFANKYYDSYHDLLNQYVEFLRHRVGELYPEADLAISNLSNDIL